VSRTGLWLASAVVVASNLCALGLAAINRQGEPEAALQLTERELTLVPGGTENTAISLRLRWTDPGKFDGEVGWFDRAKLVELGFDCRLPVTAKNSQHYRRMPSRQAYVALECDGPAWQRYAASLPAGANPRVGDNEPHLVLIDVARDAARLRARYPDRTRVVIAQAVVGVAVVHERGREPALKGQVVEVLPSELYLPRDLRLILEPLAVRPDRARANGPTRAALSPRGPRYEVAVRWGRSLEPWVESIRVTDGSH
jgi:hypothetical protein